MCKIGTFICSYSGTIQLTANLTTNCAMQCATHKSNQYLSHKTKVDNSLLNKVNHAKTQSRRWLFHATKTRPSGVVGKSLTSAHHVRTKLSDNIIMEARLPDRYKLQCGQTGKQTSTNGDNETNLISYAPFLLKIIHNIGRRRARWHNGDTGGRKSLFKG